MKKQVYLLDVSQQETLLLFPRPSCEFSLLLAQDIFWRLHSLWPHILSTIFYSPADHCWNLDPISAYLLSMWMTPPRIRFSIVFLNFSIIWNAWSFDHEKHICNQTIDYGNIWRHMALFLIKGERTLHFTREILCGNMERQHRFTKQNMCICVSLKLFKSWIKITQKRIFKCDNILCSDAKLLL